MKQPLPDLYSTIDDVTLKFKCAKADHIILRLHDLVSWYCDCLRSLGVDLYLGDRGHRWVPESGAYSRGMV